MDTPALTTPQYTGLQSRILDFLGQGIGASTVANAVGVTESYISQLLADETFRGEVRRRRMEALQETTALDQTYHRIEVKAAEKLENAVAFMSNPKQLLEIIKTVNNTKRRGAGSEPTEQQAGMVIELRLPTGIAAKFVDTKTIQRDQNNQILQTGDQVLITAQAQSIRDAHRKEDSKDTSQTLEVTYNDTSRESASQSAESGPSKRAIRSRPESLSLADLE